MNFFCAICCNRPAGGGESVDWIGVERVELEAEDECDYESRGGEFVMPEEGKRGIKGAV